MNNIQFLSSLPEFASIFPLPEPGQKLVPEWYRKQPGLIDDKYEGGTLKLTVKKCQPFFDAMSMGYIFRMPVDLYINTKDGNLDFQIPREFASHQAHIIANHSTEQVSHYPIDLSVYVNHILRIHPMWMVKTPPGYSTLFTSPAHQPHIPIRAVDAIVDTDNFFSDGHISFFLEKDFEGVIKQGTPIIQILPFKRDDWEMTVDPNHDPLITEVQRKGVRSSFQNGYRMKHWVKKIFK